jgi:predicted Zn-dependent protease
VPLLRPDDWQLRARGFEARRLWCEASWAYEQILHKEPGNGDALQHVAMIRIQQNRDQEAAILARRLIQMPSHQVVGYVTAGLVEFRVHNPTQAVQLIEQALAISPNLDDIRTDRASVLEWLAEGLIEVGRPAEAERYALLVRDLSPEPGACYILGQARQQLGDEKGALSAWKEALARDPTHVESVIEIARVHLRNNDPKEASRWATRARQLEPENDTVTYLASTIEKLLDQQTKSAAPIPASDATPP